MLRRRLACPPLGAALVLAGFLIASFTFSARAAEPRALLELFTSQGCSPVPPPISLLGD